jgi:hypothetical protein
MNSKTSAREQQGRLEQLCAVLETFGMLSYSSADLAQDALRRANHSLANPESKPKN